MSDDPKRTAAQNATFSFLDTTSQYIELCAGYKARAIEAGFSIPVAEEMALDMHRTIMERDRKARAPK